MCNRKISAGKTSQKDYLERLSKHHAVIVAAMKAKQNAGGNHALSLEKVIREMAVYYPVHRE